MAPKTPFEEAQARQTTQVPIWNCWITIFQATYTKATTSELARNYSTAFTLYLSAAQSFLHLARTTPEQADLLKKEAAKCLARAEKIKKVKEVRRVTKDILSEGKSVDARN